MNKVFENIDLAWKFQKRIKHTARLLDGLDKEDPGMHTPERFFQVRNQKEYQNVVIISFVHLEKINIFCFMHKGVVQKLSLPRPLEN